MTESDYLEWNFIMMELKRWGIELRELMVNSIVDKDIISKEDHDHLRDEISFITSREGEKGGRIKFLFPDKGRLVELMYRKNRSRARESSRVSTNSILYGIKDRSKKNKKQAPNWYNKNVWGRLNLLVGRISYGFSESVRLDLRKRLIDPFKTA